MIRYFARRAVDGALGVITAAPVMELVTRRRDRRGMSAQTLAEHRARIAEAA